MQRHQWLVASGAMHHLIGDQTLWFGVAENYVTGEFVMFASRPDQAEAGADQWQALAANADDGAGRDVAAWAGAGRHAGVKQVYIRWLIWPANGERFDEFFAVRRAYPAFTRENLAGMLQVGGEL